MDRRLRQRHGKTFFAAHPLAAFGHGLMVEAFHRPAEHRAHLFLGPVADVVLHPTGLVGRLGFGQTQKPLEENLQNPIATDNPAGHRLPLGGKTGSVVAVVFHPALRVHLFQHFGNTGRGDGKIPRQLGGFGIPVFGGNQIKGFEIFIRRLRRRDRRHNTLSFLQNKNLSPASPKMPSGMAAQQPEQGNQNALINRIFNGAGRLGKEVAAAQQILEMPPRGTGIQIELLNNLFLSKRALFQKEDRNRKGRTVAEHRKELTKLAVVADHEENKQGKDKN